MHVSLEVRLKVTDADGNCAMLRRGNIWKETKQRVLIPFGGGIKAVSHDIDRFRTLLSSVKVGGDLRFSATKENYQEIVRLFRQITPARMFHEARREFTEEALTERHLLTHVPSCRLTYLKKIVLSHLSVRSKTWGEPALSCVGVVRLFPSEGMLAELVYHSAGKDVEIEFVPSGLLKQEAGAYTNKGSFVPPVYAYLA